MKHRLKIILSAIILQNVLSACGQARLPTEARVFESIAQNMVFVAGGTYAKQKGRAKVLPRKVRVSDFRLSKYELTQKQWLSVMEKKPETLKNYCPDCPMPVPTYGEAMDFVRVLNLKTGKNYRLPTEVEWEYAARGGTKTKNYQYSGSNRLAEVAWFRKSEKDTANILHKTGTKTPNELGLYDMQGNVSEWCTDVYGSYQTQGYAPDSIPDSGFRRLRGGAVQSPKDECFPFSQRLVAIRKKALNAGIRLAASPPANMQKVKARLMVNIPGNQVTSGQETGRRSIAFSPDGSKVLVANTASMVRLWDTKTGRLLHELSKGFFPAFFEFSPDGKKILLIDDQRIYIRSVPTMKLLQSINLSKVAAPTDSLYQTGIYPMTARFLRDPSKLMTLVNQELFYLDLGDLRLKKVIKKEHDPITTFALSADASLVAVLYGKTWVQVRNTSDGSFVQNLFSGDVKTTFMSFASDTSFLLATGGHKFRYWHVKTEEEITQYRRKTSLGNFMASPSADGKTIWMYKDAPNNILEKWSVAQGKVSQKISLGRNQDGPATVLATSPTRNLLATAHPTGKVTLRRGAAFLWQIEAGPDWHHVALSPDNRRIWMGSEQGQVRFWDIEERKAGQGKLPSGSSRDKKKAKFASQTVAIRSVDGTKTITGNKDGICQVIGDKGSRKFKAHNAGITHLALSPDASKLATVGAGSQVKVWNTATKKQLFAFGNNQRVKSIKFSLDGSLLLVRLWGGFQVRSALTGRQIPRFGGHRIPAYALCCSPDGSKCAAVSLDKMVWVKDLKTNKNLFELKHDTIVSAANFSPNQKYVAIAIRNKIELWDIQTKKLIQTFSGHRADITGIVFTSDNKKIISTSQDQTTRLWSIKQNKLLATLYTCFSDPSAWLVVAPDGKYDGNPQGLKNMHYVTDTQKVLLSGMGKRPVKNLLRMLMHK